MSEKYPVLACSADGIVVCKCKIQHINKLVEIKCPYALRENNPRDVALQKKCVFNEENNKWEVDVDCPYYAQIQGQLGLYEIDECDLVIYTKKGIHISTVKFDIAYFQTMVHKLLNFHRNYVVERIFHSVLSE
jgi:hypothetical protein